MKKILPSALALFLLLSSCVNHTDKQTTSSTSPSKPAITATLGEGSTVITTSEYKNLVKVAPIVLVDFSATWCGPCKMLAPRLDELKKDMPGRFTLVKSDVDRDADLADSVKITAMPTLMLYKNGELVWTSVGLIEKNVIADKIKDAEKN